MCLYSCFIKYDQNCFICCFRFALLFGYTGITPLNFHCDHSKRPVKCSLERSRLGTLISALSCTIALCVGVHNAYTLYGTKISSREDVLHLEAVMVNFIAMYLITLPLRFQNIKLRELEGIIQLISYGEKIGIICLDKSFVKTCTRLILTLILLFVSLEVFTVVHFLITADFSLTAFKTLFTDTCIFMQGTVGVHYISLHLLLLHIFQKILYKLKYTLKSRLRHNTKETNLALASHKYFAMEIRRICRFYKSIHLNFLEDNKFLGLGFVIWWNTVLAVNIISVYVLLNSIMIQEPLETSSLFFILKVYGCMVGIVIYLAEMEVTASVVSISSIYVFVVTVKLITHYVSR